MLFLTKLDENFSPAIKWGVGLALAAGKLMGCLNNIFRKPLFFLKIKSLFVLNKHRNFKG